MGLDSLVDRIYEKLRNSIRKHKTKALLSLAGLAFVGSTIYDTSDNKAYADNNVRILKSDEKTCDPNFNLKVADEKILLSNTQGVEGGSLGLSYNPSVIDVTDIQPSGVLAALSEFRSPDYLQIILDPILDECSQEIQAGAALGWVNSISAGGVVIQPGTNQEIFKIYSKPAENPNYNVSKISFVDCLKARTDTPQIRNIVSIEGNSVIPCTEDGEISIGGFFRRGDTNEDGVVNISDSIQTIRYLFVPGKSYPECLDAFDTNDNGIINIADVIYPLMWLFSPELSPAPPFPGAYKCGPDLTLDKLVCDVSQPECREEAEEQMYEYYNTGDDNRGDIYKNFWYGQIFTVGVVGTNEDHEITKTSVKIYRVGLPKILTTSIYAIGGNNFPTGSALSSGETDGDTLTTANLGEWYNITMSPYRLRTSTQYALVLSALDGDPPNRVCWRVGSSPTYMGGTNIYSPNAGSGWNDPGNFDFMFEIYGRSVNQQLKLND